MSIFLERAAERLKRRGWDVAAGRIRQLKNELLQNGFIGETFESMSRLELEGHAPKLDKTVELLEKARRGDSPFILPSDISNLPLGEVENHKQVRYLKRAIENIEKYGTDSLYNLGLSQTVLNLLARELDIKSISGLEEFDLEGLMYVRGMGEIHRREVFSSLRKYHERLMKHFSGTTPE